MSDNEKKLIYILLVIIVVFSGILIIKINIAPKYDPELYDEIYSEYDDILKVAENATEDSNDSTGTERNITYIHTGLNSSGTQYKVAGEIMIPKLKIVYPVVNDTTDENLKIAPTKFAGPNMNEIGNFCIVGHNYKNNQFFSKLSQLEANDQVCLTSNNGKKINYKVYDMYEVYEKDLSCTSQDTGGKIEATLITCTSNKKNRLIIKCIATN